MLRATTKSFRRDVARWLATFFKNPNTFSVSAIFAAILFIVFHYVDLRYFALLALLFAYLVDVFDGSLARVLGKASKWGNYLDAMVDKYVEALVYVGLGLTNPFPALLAALGSLIESYAKPRTAMVVPIDNRDWPAIGERVERCAIIAIGYGIYALFGLPNLFLDYVLYLVAAITWVGSVQRVMYAKEIIKKGGT